MTINATPYSVPKDPGRGRALTLAAMVHAALIAFLWFGVHWQNEAPIAIEAEVWSITPEKAAPPPTPVPEPAPEVKEIPKPVEPVVNPDIALEKEKKRKVQEQKVLEEEKKKQALDDRKKEEEAKRKQALKEQALRDKARGEDMKRMMAQAGAGVSGTAPKTQGGRGNAEYIARVAAKIKSNTFFVLPESLEGNPAVEYAIELLPDGSLRRPVRKLKSSGVPGFDEAVLNAIEKSQPYPQDKSGTVPSGFNLVHKPKDQ